MKFTIIGGEGFIGSGLAGTLRECNAVVSVPPRDDPRIFSEDLGHVFYCAGVTADFRFRPYDTVRAHVSTLGDLLERARFDSLLYLSSTRVYARNESTNESERIIVDPGDPSDLYNLSKLMGESMCLALDRSSVRVVRLSNVYGEHQSEDTFLGSVMATLAREGSVTLHTSLDASKDYVSMKDVTSMLPRIALKGQYRIYNLAGGLGVSNREILRVLTASIGGMFDVAGDAFHHESIPIDIRRVCTEFEFRPMQLLEQLPGLARAFKEELRK